MAGGIGQLGNGGKSLFAEVYRERVLGLRQALESKAEPEIIECLRALIERVEVHAPAVAGGAPRIELLGHLAAMLRAAGFGGEGNAKSPPAMADGLDVFVCSESLDAGTGFEPVTFRL